MLVEAAEMGNPDAQYDLGCRLRAEVITDKPDTLTCYLHSLLLQLRNLNTEIELPQTYMTN